MVKIAKIIKADAGSDQALLYEEIFESGHAVNRIAQTTYKEESSFPLGPFGLLIGVLAALFGMMPIMKYFVEDGRSDMALMGVALIVIGIVVGIFGGICDIKRSEQKHQRYEEHRQKVRNNLLARYINKPTS